VLSATEVNFGLLSKAMYFTIINRIMIRDSQIRILKVFFSFFVSFISVMKDSGAGYMGVANSVLELSAREFGNSSFSVSSTFSTFSIFSTSSMLSIFSTF
jgi:hypothetical protein